MPKNKKKLKKNKVRRKASKPKKSKKSKKAKKIKAKSLKKAKSLRAKSSTKSTSSKKSDRQEEGMKKLLARGKERGYVTYDEILKEFPTVEEDIIFLDDLYEKLSVSGIDILEGGGLLDTHVADDLINKKYSYGRNSEASYDSIQMYLKEIGQYPLITDRKSVV